MGLYPKKIMLSVWWNFKGLFYYELLPVDRTIDSTAYYSQLNKLSNGLRQKLPEFVNRKGVVTPYVINHPVEIVESSMGCFTSSFLFTRLGIVLLAVVLVVVKFFEVENLKAEKKLSSVHYGELSLTRELKKRSGRSFSPIS